MFTTCDNYTDGHRCNRPGELYLFGHDGKKLPGGKLCRECADAVITEYREKLGWNWTAKEER